MRRGFSGTLQAVGEKTDGVVVFGMHHDEGAGFARDAHHIEHFHVGERETLIRHEHLERGVAVMHERGQFLAEHGIARIRDDEMERDVDIAAAVSFLVIGGDHLAQGFALLLHGEGQHHGVAAEGCRSRRRGEIVGHDDAGAGWLGDMDMAVDAAGQEELAGNVDNLPGVVELVAQRRDAPAADADIAGERVGCCRDRAAA